MTVAVATAAPPRWNRWMSLAAALLIVSGLFKILDGLWAFKYDEERSEEVFTVIFERDLIAWGWVWIAMGVLLVAAGLSVVTGAEWARWVGIIAAGLATITYLPWIYYQPLWTILSVSLAMVVLFALLSYGGRQLRE